jgi:hypothetical protein
MVFSMDNTLHPFRQEAVAILQAIMLLIFMVFFRLESIGKGREITLLWPGLK